MPHHNVKLNPLLASAVSGDRYYSPVLIQWDVRFLPRRSARVAGEPITPHQLSQMATIPPVSRLRVISGLLSDNWPITVYNPEGVTVEDVLGAIHEALYAPLTISEWELMSPRKRARIEEIFYARCRASRDFERTRQGGVRRADCMITSTTFAGLSSLTLRHNRWEVVMTLSRDFSARHQYA
ncbi:hypothetical protein F5I97DRAFT_1075207 [Phlebopus sp. FC_14]|nr:hypothetical protein F5I97DRAFT_1075207 [Phlebopus sp. FC_14]